MGKITSLKNSWIRIADQAINLNLFSNIQKGEFGLLESNDERYYIEVTELKKNEDGSYNRYIITSYKESEKELWDEDYEIIIKSLNS
jgi:hypothetical protein